MFIYLFICCHFADIDSQLEKTKLDKIYVTALVADEGLLWVGTSVGVTLVFPLPFLEGVPLVSGRSRYLIFSVRDCGETVQNVIAAFKT